MCVDKSDALIMSAGPVGTTVIIVCKSLIDMKINQK